MLQIPGSITRGIILNQLYYVEDQLCICRCISRPLQWTEHESISIFDTHEMVNYLGKIR